MHGQKGRFASRTALSRGSQATVDSEEALPPIHRSGPGVYSRAARLTKQLVFSGVYLYSRNREGEVMRPERREHEASFEEQGMGGGCRILVAHRHVPGRGVKPLYGRLCGYNLLGRNLHPGKDGDGLGLGPLSEPASRRLRGLLGLAVVGFLILGLFLTAPTPLPAQGVVSVAGKATSSCAFLQLKNAPSWVVSGAWRGPQNLTLIDSFKSRMVDYRISRRSGAIPPQEVALDLAKQRPVRIQAGGSHSQEPNFFVELDGNRFLAVDERLRPVSRSREENIVGASVQSGNVKVGSLFDWQIAGGNVVVAYGTVVEATTPDEWRQLENWRHGFIRYFYGQPWTVKVYRPTKFPDPGEAFYRLGYPMLAAVGGDVFALGVENFYPVLYQFPEDKNKVPVRLRGVLPREIADQQLPALPKFVAPADYPLAMKAVEESRMPAGLYGWKDSLFILFRTPASQGTIWKIARIKGGQATKLVELPTRANHVTLIPGPKDWALLEKGPIEELGTQVLQKMILIPSANFEGDLKAPFCN